MEKHGLAAAVLALVPLLAAGCARPPLRGAVALAGDGQSSWVFVETKDPDRNGIWWCSASAAEGDGSGPPRCVKARMLLQTPRVPRAQPAPEAAQSALAERKKMRSPASSTATEISPQIAPQNQ